MPSRGIFVISAPRSGSSLTAGCLHKMGVNMGQGFLQRADEHNPRGYYEDKRWRKLTTQMTGVRYDVRQPSQLPYTYELRLKSLFPWFVDERVWGVKDTRMCFVFNLFKPYLLDQFEDIRVIHLIRDQELVISSLIKHSQTAYGGRFELSEEQATSIITDWQKSALKAYNSFQGEKLEIRLEDFLQNPEDTLLVLETFAFDGIMSYSQGIDKALAFVDKGIIHE